ALGRTRRKPNGSVGYCERLLRWNVASGAQARFTPNCAWREPLLPFPAGIASHFRSLPRRLIMQYDNMITVACTKQGHGAATFKRTEQEVDDDGTQVLVKQYYKADCGCELMVTYAVPRTKP